jgi:hypothetical protein
MSVEGKWTVTVKAPTGPTATTLILESVDGVLTGTHSGDGSTSKISEARLDGNNLYWVNRVTKPFTMRLEFCATVDGNQMAGSVKTGFMGSYPFTGAKE